MQHRLSLFPQPGDEPTSRMCGTDGDIPVLVLDERHVEIAFHDLDAAVIYLDALSEVATDLATKVRIYQRQANLLDAVRNTPHNPAAAADIRAKYADEDTPAVTP